jgi:hypothetical protein
MTDVEPLAAADYDPPLWLQAVSYPAGVDRDLIDAVFPTAGIIAPGDFLVAPRAAGANMSVDVAPGKIVIAGTDITGQGKYVGRLKNTVNVPITAAPGAGLTRITRIVARIQDATVIGGANNLMTVETPVDGTPGSTPTYPGVPASAFLLADLTVASGTAAITAGLIADRRTLAAAANPGPYVLGGEVAGTTDSFGNFTLTNVVPAGGKVISAVACGSQSTFLTLVVRNNTDMPAGGRSVIFRVFNGAGAGVANSTVAIAYTICWSF